VLLPFKTVILGLFFLAAILAGCAHAPEHAAGDLAVTIAHVNDTHSHLEPADFALIINGQATGIKLGGFAALKSALDELRTSEPNMLFLHGGDMVQGTLYFTKYKGSADIYLLNLLGLDGAAAGNHEFDRGPALLASLVESANFPIVSSNIDVSNEPILAGKIAPYMIKSIGREKIGIIGLTTTETPFISNPGSRVKFLNPAMSVKAAVDELYKRNIRKIIVLSHLGYEEDIALAKKVSGIQIIVGANSHTLLGDMKVLTGMGLHPEGPYPTVIKNAAGRDVLIVQAWEWAKMLGVISLRFNGEGEITDWKGSPRLIAGTVFRRNDAQVPGGSIEYKEITTALQTSGIAAVYEEDASVRSKIEIYKGPIKEMMTTIIAESAQYLRRGNNTGPGPLFADAMLWKTRAAGAQVAFQNTGGIRRDLPAGKISTADIYELLPFNNTLVLIDIKGSDLLSAIEEGLDYQIAIGSKAPYLYVSGITFKLDEKKPKGKRITDMMVRQSDGSYVPLQDEQTLRVVANSYLADGGDGMHILKRAASYHSDTGFIDTEVMIEYLKELGMVKEQTEKRISYWMFPAAFCAVLLQQRESDREYRIAA
jgi:5'-nucleotidase